jgi:phosphoserine phosphatase RsbU/P
MLMSNLQASLRIITPENINPADVVSRLNQLFCHNIRLTKFVTFFLARIDEATRTLIYCNAGHNPPLLRHADGTIERLLPTGAAIGLIEQTGFLQKSVALQQGDRMILYTDGVVESFSKIEEQFGEGRLEKFLHDSSKLPTSQVIASLRETLHQFTQTTAPIDDTTVIVLTAV